MKKLLAKINLKRVAVTCAITFGTAFVASASSLPHAVGTRDWSTARDAAVAGAFAGLAALVELVYHLVTPGRGDPTA